MGKYRQSPSKIKEIIDNHWHWLTQDVEGWEEMKANLSGFDLSGFDLSNTNLHHADLSYSDLSEVDLSYTDLSYANLHHSDLRYANLRYVDLRSANLHYTDLHYADLRSADLSSADLSHTDLSNFSYNENTKLYLPLACPTDGRFIAWKKVKNYLIKLEIPEDARRLSSFSNKCRCDKAMVLSITNISTSKELKSIENDNFAPCTYTVGEMIYPDSFDENRWNECSHGIHFFINKQEAINYQY